MRSAMTADDRTRRLREAIRAAASDTSLTEADRARAMQSLLTEGRWGTETGPSAVMGSSSPPGTKSACAHYARGCDVDAPCCGVGIFVSCRLCHDEAKDHLMVRGASRFMRCRACDLVQPVARSCSAPTCAWKESRYWCERCRLWEDNLNKAVFHCDDCGICRLGRREDYWHCERCALCWPLASRDDHACLAGASADACPVCLEPDMRTSPRSVVMLACGHAMHSDCQQQLLASGSPVCPKCRRSIARDRAFEAHVRSLLETTPMPPEFAQVRAEVLCNDCGAKSVVPFHFYGAVCPAAECGSVNTSILQTLRGGSSSPASSAPSSSSSS